MTTVQPSTTFDDLLLGRWGRSFAVQNRSQAYTLLQKAVGWCALTLCPIVVLSDLFFGDPSAAGAPAAGELRGSVSAYYYGVGGDWFVGALFAMAFFFFSYQINPEDDDLLVDKRLSSFAALCAVLVALFPTPLSGEDRGIVGTVHGVAAALLFISMAIFSSYHFTKTKDEVTCKTLWSKRIMRFVRTDWDVVDQSSVTPQKIIRNRLYRIWGAQIVFALVGAVVALLMERYKWSFLSIEPAALFFWSEVVAVISFGLSWLVKGGQISALNDKPAPNKVLSHGTIDWTA